jgi:hypothetical protein
MPKRSGTKTVDSRPEAVWRAGDRPLVLEIWIVGNVSPDVNGSQVYYGFDKDVDQAVGIPFPMNTVINIPLDPGETLYILADDTGRVGYNVHPGRGL